MIRTQVQLDGRQAKALKRMASERGVSIAALIRQAVDALIRDDERIRDALAVAGKWNSGIRDLAEDHDRYLNEGKRW